MNCDLIRNSPRFQEFLADVRVHLHALNDNQPNRQTALAEEKRLLTERLAGWLQSLAKPDLPATIRTAIETEFTAAQNRIGAIDAEIAAEAALSGKIEAAVDAEDVLDCVTRLEEVLAGTNPSATNLILAHHIDAIVCGPDGKVVIRTCKLGALAGARELLRKHSDKEESPPPCAEGVYAASPRKRARLDVGEVPLDDDDLDEAVEFVTNPQRFAGLGPEWFTEDVLHYQGKPSWAKMHAEEVAQFRLSSGATMEVTAKHFGKTVPTIRKALSYAKAEGIDAFGLEVSQATRKPNWAMENAQKVAAYIQETGQSVYEAADHFGFSDTTIRKALRYAAAAKQADSTRDQANDDQHGPEAA